VLLSALSALLVRQVAVEPRQECLRHVIGLGERERVIGV